VCELGISSIETARVGVGHGGLSPGTMLAAIRRGLGDVESSISVPAAGLEVLVCVPNGLPLA
jgi:hypothetical protein